MSPMVYQLFETICRKENIAGPVLEVGAVAGPDCLLNMSCLSRSGPKIGINQKANSQETGIRFIQMNSHDMTCFEDDYFKAVLCNATLEHDPLFWKTLSEIYRVTASNGLIVIGVPGYSGMGINDLFPKKSIKSWIFRFIAKIIRDDGLNAATVTLGEHFFPDDYYRFSEQAVREVFMDGLIDVEIHRVMHPPRFIGSGRKP